MNKENTLQQAVDELFALHEQVEKDHTAQLQALQQVVATQREYLAKHQISAQETATLITHYQDTLAQVKNDLQPFQTHQALWWRANHYVMIMVLIFLLGAAGFSAYLGHYIANQQALLNQLNYRLEEIPIVHHNKKATYVMIKKDSQLKVSHNGQVGYVAEIIRPRLYYRNSR